MAFVKVVRPSSSFSKTARPGVSWSSVAIPGTFIPAGQFDVGKFDVSEFDVEVGQLQDTWSKTAKPSVSWAKTGRNMGGNTDSRADIALADQAIIGLISEGWTPVERIQNE